MVSDRWKSRYEADEGELTHFVATMGRDNGEKVINIDICPMLLKKKTSAARLAKEIENSWYPDQYSNLAPLAHMKSTGPEIWRQTVHFVANQLLHNQ